MFGDSLVVEYPPHSWKVGIAVALLGQERSPQPPWQETSYRLQPAGNCRRQKHIKNDRYLIQFVVAKSTLK